MEILIVTVIVLAAGIYVLRSLLKMSKGSSACGGCKSGCQMRGTCSSKSENSTDHGSMK